MTSSSPADGSASGALKEARQTWGRMRQSEMIQTAIEKATTAQQGFEAGLRAEFKSLYRAYLDKRPKMRGVSPELAKAIEGCCRGQRDLEHLEAHRFPELVAAGRRGPCRTCSRAARSAAVSASRSAVPLVRQSARRWHRWQDSLHRAWRDSPHQAPGRYGAINRGPGRDPRTGRRPDCPKRPGTARCGDGRTLPLAALLAGPERRGR